jgi:KDO2-lipid IV(A) lauroyltransferase
MSSSHFFLDMWERSLYRIMRLLPVEATSAIGSLIVRLNVRLNRPQIIADAKSNIIFHRPDLDPAQVKSVIWRFVDNVGRFMAEFAVLDKLMPQGRIKLELNNEFMAAVGREPIIAIVLHTGNWEVFGPGLQSAGIETATFYEPPETRFRRKIAEETRRYFGFSLLPPTSRGVRDALRVLKNNGFVSIFGDEARNGVTMAPLFGRPPHDRGNLAIVARLARRAGARIVTAHCERIEACQFKLFICKPFELPTTTPEQSLLKDVAFLNSVIEPIILANLDRWYFLDDSLRQLENNY